MASDESEQLNYSFSMDQFLNDVYIGLGGQPKTLPPKYFYDDAGSILFNAICNLDEYYLTRTETDILINHANEIAEVIGSNTMLIEYGSGSLEKIRILMDALDGPEIFVPIDICERQLIEAAEGLRNSYPELIVKPVVADFTGPFILPSPSRTELNRVAFFPGSTIGNFDPKPARSFLASIADVLGKGGGLLIGIDLQKDADQLVRAYDDKLGITAAFNKNLLARINRELQGDFSLELFQHVARFNMHYGRIEMHLESLEDQIVTVSKRIFNFAAGESIHTENSYKYTLDGFDAIAGDAHFIRRAYWTDPKELFAIIFYVCDS